MQPELSARFEGRPGGLRAYVKIWGPELHVLTEAELRRFIRELIAAERQMRQAVKGESD